jgi:hypothetical protein
MSWERRGGRGLYYTRTRRVNGKVVREYFGAGPVGRVAAALDARARDRRAAEAAALRAEEQRLAGPEAAMRALDAGCRLLTRTALVAAGRFSDGARRGQRMSPEDGLEPGEPAAVGELRALMERARAGDRTVLGDLRRALDEHPEIWNHFGDLAAHAVTLWVGLAAGPDLALAESLARKVAALASELAGPAPGPLERLLAERAAACWLQASYLDALAAQARDVSVAQADLVARRQDAAHRRYVGALGALAGVRRRSPARARAAGGSRGSPAGGPRGEDHQASCPALRVGPVPDAGGSGAKRGRRRSHRRPDGEVDGLRNGPGGD